MINIETSRVKVFILGKMEENMMVNGRMGNSMGKENTFQRTEKIEQAFGKMVSESNGLIIKNNEILEYDVYEQHLKKIIRFYTL